MVTVLDKLTADQKAQLKKGVVEVSGRHMNRTALGIVDAIVQLYPNATFDELKKILPDSINPAAPKNYRSLFRPYTDRMYGVIQPGSIRKESEAQGIDLNASHFTDYGETFKSADGVEILVAKSWESKDSETGAHDLQNLINHAEHYGVRVVEFIKEKPLTKGGYTLEVINPVLYNELRNPKTRSQLWWIIGLLGLIIFGAIWYLFNNERTTLSRSVSPDRILPAKAISGTVLKKDEITQLKEDVIAGKDVTDRVVTFDDIFFEFNSDKIKKGSDSNLIAALGLLNELLDLRVEIIGHTSDEGNVRHNQKLSEKRAIAVKNWLIKQGIEKGRLETLGKGSSENVADNDTEENREKNRRIQFKVVN